MWLLVIRKNGRSVFHSPHVDRATAEAWKKCKEHEGEDCELVEVQNDDLEDFAEFVKKCVGD